MGNEYEKYQIPQAGVDSSTLGPPTLHRSLHEKMSDWNAKYTEPRMPASQDYTKTVLTFKSKDELSEIQAVVPVWQYAERDENPYTVGSTVKKFRDDQFFRMTMEHPATASGLDALGDYPAATPAYIDVPRFDVMDTNLVTGTMTSGINYPTEGWHSYGGKYDFNIPYVGW